MPRKKQKRKLKRNLKNEKTSRPEKGAAEKIRAHIFSPAFNVVAFIILLLSVFGGLRILKGNNAQAQIKFVENGTFNGGVKDNGNSGEVRPAEIFRGEVYDTSIRLRETGALGMAISLAVFGVVSEQGSVPADLGTIWDFIKGRNLMPPGLAFNDGELTSQKSIFLVRFQSSPFRFEILSSPKEANTSSPSIMMRFPLNSFDGRSVSYFQSSSINAYEIPLPFAPLEKVLASGWKIEQWRGEFLPGDQNPQNLLREEKRLLEKLPKNR
jgi:hypothetical protein